jgi:hypothetical protein
MKNEEKGQISIELILVVGAILTMVVVAIPMILKSAEMNRGLTAARDGATKAIALRGMGYSEGEGNEAGVMKMTEITVVSLGPFDDNELLVLLIRISAPSEMQTDDNLFLIRAESSSFINHALNGEYDRNWGFVDGSYYTFLPTVIWV